MTTVPGDVVGRGPAAIVHSGLHEGRPVALKVFPAAFDRHTTTAYTREHTALRSVLSTSPSLLLADGVVTLPSGVSALRMELCAQSLGALVARVGPLPVPDVLALGHALASALAAVHDAGVVHGGVTPSNVLLRASGEPLLADTGLALRQAFPRDPLHAIEFRSPDATRTDAPREPDDLYALGAVLHFALTGGTPHPGRLGEKPGERVLRVLREPVPAINKPGVPVELATLVARMLAADPGHRPLDAATVAARFAEITPPAPVDEFDDFSAVAGPVDAPPVVPPAPIAPPAAPPMGAYPPAPPQPARIPVASFDFQHQTRTRRLPRTLLRVGVPVLLLAAGVGTFALLHTPSDETTETPAGRHTAQAPPPPSTSSSPVIQLELADPQVTGDQVELTWTSSVPLDYVVVVAAEGDQGPKLMPAGRQASMKVPVEQGRKYCFQVRASSPTHVYESLPKPIRGAVCRN